LEAKQLGLEDPTHILLSLTEVQDFPSSVFPLPGQFSSSVSDVLAMPTSPLSPLASVSWMAGWEAPPSALPSQGSAVAQSNQASFLCHGGGRGWLGGLSKVGQEMALPLC